MPLSSREIVRAMPVESFTSVVYNMCGRNSSPRVNWRSAWNRRCKIAVESGPVLSSSIYEGLRPVLNDVWSCMFGRSHSEMRGAQFKLEFSVRDVSQPRSTPPMVERASSSALRSAARALARFDGSKSRDERALSDAVIDANG